MGHLRRKGHQARILTTAYRRDDVAADAAEDPDVHRELEWYWQDHAWRSMSLRARLQLERHNAAAFDRHLSEFRPDVITWWPVGGMSLSLIERARLAGLPALFFVLDYWPTYGPQHDLWIRAWSRHRLAGLVAQRLTGLPTRLELARAGRWLFCSEAARQETAATADIEVTDYDILPAGVDELFLSSPRQEEPAPWRWRLLYVGRVVEQKGVHTAIEALPLLSAEATLRIVGDGDAPYRDRLQELAARLGVSDRIEFEPARPRSELAAIYRESDVVLFPVLWTEPWGLVPLEAMALGRPVVATGRGGSGDYLVDGVNSLLFDAGDARALARALTELAQDDALRRRIVADGYETAGRNSEHEFNRRALAEIEAVVGARTRR
jgi:glycosyltransferase involved in cell wall biosynthesis